MAEDNFKKILESALHLSDKIKHDSVVRASAATYPQSLLDSQGLQLDMNIDSKKRRIGGESDPIYPDVVLWKPHYIGSPKGKAVVIEKIETEKSIENNWPEWPKFVRRGVIFNLIVQVNKASFAKQKLSELGIFASTRLQTYELDKETNEYKFITLT